MPQNALRGMIAGAVGTAALNMTTYLILQPQLDDRVRGSQRTNQGGFPYGAEATSETGSSVSH